MPVHPAPRIVTNLQHNMQYDTPSLRYAVVTTPHAGQLVRLSEGSAVAEHPFISSLHRAQWLRRSCERLPNVESPMKARVFSAVSRHCWIIAAAFVVLCGVTTAGTAHAQPCGGMQDLGPVNEAVHNTADYALNHPADKPEQRTILRRGSKPGPGVGTADFDVVVTRVHDEQCWFRQRVSVIRGLPLTLALEPAGHGGQPNDLVATVTCSNPLEVPLNAGTLTLTGGSGLLINGTARSEEIPVGPLASGETATFTRTLSAATLEEQTVFARWFVPGTVPGESTASITLLPTCPCDFNNNGTHEIGDYFAYLTAFFAQLGGPGSADFDDDGTVTIGDYFAFLSCLPEIAASTPCP